MGAWYDNPFFKCEASLFFSTPEEAFKELCGFFGRNLEEERAVEAMESVLAEAGQDDGPKT